MERLRIGTLNIWNRGGPWERRLPLIRCELERVRPDLVGLQEVLRLGAANQAAEIAEGLGYEIAYGPAMDLGEGLWLGNAVLSRFSIAVERHWALPGDAAEGRSLLMVQVESPWGKVPMFCTHLSYRAHEGYLRLQQVRAVAEIVSREAPIQGFPPTLVGDFNAVPESDEIRFLKGLAVVEGRSVYFADAYEQAGEPPGHTWSGLNPYTAEFHETDRRIDYIFVRGPNREGVGKVLSAELAWCVSSEGVFPSDHFGVVAEVTATPIRAGNAG